jgi:ribosomal protein S18 acetylase RimI-like enzyme
MQVAQRIVGIQGHPQLVLPADPPLGVAIRAGGPADLAAVARIEAESFDDFWRWGDEDLLGFLADERLAVACARGGAIIGYTLATVSRGSATLTRLATAPHARGAGVGRALLSEAAAWAASKGAVTFALCTQEENSASRSVYAAAGLTELDERYAFAIGDVAKEVRV